MSFAERVLQFTFSGAQSGSFTASGLRAIASIQGVQGRLGVAAMVKIWGLSLPQMNAYSTVIPSAVGIEKYNLVIEAGDMGGTLSEVVNAAILGSYIDLTGSPESAFVVAVNGIYTGANPTDGQSQPGAQNAEDLIASICAGAGFKLNNNGAHAVLRNQVTYGSALDQIERIAQAAGFAWSWSGTTFSIWPWDGFLDDVTVQVGPKTTPKLVGYPRYYPLGITVTSLFNQQVQLGRKMQVIGSSIPKANGIWQIAGVQHDLSTMLPGGPWFTTATLAPLSS